MQSVAAIEVSRIAKEAVVPIVPLNFNLATSPAEMEVPFDLSSSLKNCPVERLDRNFLKRTSPFRNPGLQAAIDQIGLLSSNVSSPNNALTFTKPLGPRNQTSAHDIR